MSSATQEIENHLNLKEKLTRLTMKEYLLYLDFGTVLTLHCFITAFFALWSYASNTLYSELLATKFLHCVFPALASKWWFMATYPAHQNKVWTILENVDNLSTNRKKSKLNDRIILITATKITLLFVTLIIIDLIYICVRLIPILYKCGTQKYDGRTVPLECGGDGLVAETSDSSEPKIRDYHRKPTSEYHYGILYSIVILISLLHVFVGIACIFICWKLRIKFKN